MVVLLWLDLRIIM